MGTAFEAIVIGSVARAIDHASLEAFGDIVSSGRAIAVLPAQGRETSASAHEIAATLSRAWGCAAVIYYDDRTGTRTSSIYDEGRLTSTLGPDDEEWILLNEDGEPDHATRRLRLSELGTDDEAECVLSAIDQAFILLGLEAGDAKRMVRAISVA